MAARWSYSMQPANDHEKTVSFPLKKGVFIDSSSGNADCTTLHQASLNWQYKTLSNISSTEAQIQSKPREGERHPLHHTAWCGYVAVIELLWEKGASYYKTGKDCIRKKGPCIKQPAPAKPYSRRPLQRDEGANLKVEEAYGHKPHSLAIVEVKPPIIQQSRLGEKREIEICFEKDASRQVRIYLR